ncbi:VOC family protein [Streptomyces cavernicola]|uniref:VOC family protein n=1 Tax=Streptomyces cavernicola TaxID=3043613 RepID=A0ABT6S342_9ACTN|nr:VOC family protein [Streptomyces sp. B-S-A6]MDI3402463.1 VOC family protein [Streptomyces sp. B-S-A6]
MTESTARHTPGTPCWVSLMVHGMAATQEFYGALFGWEFRPGPEQLGPYVRALLDGHEVAGIGELPDDRQLPVAWTPYLATDDADATAETVRHCGGTVGVGPLDAGDAGRLAIASDSVGAVFGVWQAADHRGTSGAGRPGTPVWNELITHETAAVGTFYSHLFEYREEPLDADPRSGSGSGSGSGSDYLTLRLEGRAVVGIHGIGDVLPRERGPHWMTYFEVADVDAAATRVVELGGQVLRAPLDSAHGRLATVADPEGAVFSIVHSAG